MIPFTKIRIPEILDRVNPDTGIYYVRFALLFETRDIPPRIVPRIKIKTKDDMFKIFIPVVRRVYDDELDDVRKIDVLEKEDATEFIGFRTKFMSTKICYIKTYYHIYIDASGISDKNRQLDYVQNRAYDKLRRHRDYRNKEFATYSDVMRHEWWI